MSLPPRAPCSAGLSSTRQRLAAAALRAAEVRPVRPAAALDCDALHSQASKLWLAPTLPQQHHGITPCNIMASHLDIMHP